MNGRVDAEEETALPAGITVPADRFAKNRELVLEALLRDVDLGLAKLKALIQREYPDVLHKVSIPFVYNLYVRDKIRSDTVRQIELVLKAAERYDGTNLDALTDEYFDEYFSHDLVNHHCRHDHPRFEELKKIIRLSFRARIVPAHRVLNAPSGETYEDLIRQVYATRQATRKALEEHLVIADKAIDLIEHHKDLVKGPIYRAVYLGRNIRVIRAGYEFALELLLKRLDQIFPCEDSGRSEEVGV
ncbi:MAG: hypothetical protein Kow0069_26600 [Promethearchaeota archaeon]